MIRHLVISGGGVFGFSCFGAIRETCRLGLLDINNINSIHATSVGSMVGIFIALKYNMNEVEDYLVNRPWNRVFPFTLPALMSAVERRGIFDQTSLRELFLPFFLARDISIDITLRDFYDITQVDFHCFSTEISELKTVDFSHKTHPEWKLIDAVYCSSCLPILFSPFFHSSEEDGKTRYYMDGGLLNNYPVQECIDFVKKLDEEKSDEEKSDEVEDNKKPKEEDPDVIDTAKILGICKNNNREKITSLDAHSSTLLDYILFLFNKIIYKEHKHPETLSKEIIIDLPSISIYDVYHATTFKEERQRLIHIGVKCAQDYKTNLF
jgi:patatin-like phospholipase/acyl hydrolase